MLKKIKLLLFALLGVISYTIIFFILRIGLKYIPSFFLWSDYKLICNIYSMPMYFIDVIYYIFGMIVTTHGIINLFLISKENHKAQNMKTRKPEKLIKTGFYSRARHPMYGTFMIINLGLFLSIRSLWSILIIILFFTIKYISTDYEEKNELIKIFGNNYKEYREEVSNKFFLPIYKVYIIISVILTIVGISIFIW
ncbi:hypothetical protein GM661_07895 [Iocasia frigidifontis]|uniref:Isoprenylcysteine carboxylmethyltransferase family protein n=1 Tax=Iocasia fonsfrigidae TaxID=2682810 RepID=A0A8A7KEM8_9FIRM|nr:methyltransferase [Iocasia fonsfrigidae]QTL97909.1 hypothetical protein GM661_07895 [Iocasia fonsfrigidae]